MRVKTYSRLKEIASALSGIGLSPVEIACVGLTLIGKRPEDAPSLLANRYFLDALGLTAMPPVESLRASANAEGVSRGMALAESLAEPSFPAWEAAKATFDQKGYCVIPAVLPPEECAGLRAEILSIAERERTRGAAYLYGEGNRFQRVYNLLNKGRSFQDLIVRPIVLGIMDDLFDRETLHEKYVLSSWHANIIPPGGEAQKLHLDAAVPEPLPPWIIRANINFVLEDYTFENGATLCVPGSHKWCRRPDGQERELAAMEAKAGSMVIWHGHLWHKSGRNATDKERVGLLACFAASHLLEMAMEENHHRVVDDPVSDKLKRLLAWDHGIKAGATY